MRSTSSSCELRQELELRLNHGRCAYCGAPATRGRPLTREHLIPRSRGGRRHDPRIIVPACARCNHRRGSQELVLFLLSQPRRISRLIDHLTSLPPEQLSLVDIRIFAEIYASLWVLSESLDAGPSARSRLRQLCGGRTVHRRRYAARRVLTAVADRFGQRDRPTAEAFPICRIPPPVGNASFPGSPEALDALEHRVLDLLATAWGSTTEDVQREIDRRRERTPMPALGSREADDEAVRMDDGRGRARPMRRMRVDRRRGRTHHRRAA